MICYYYPPISDVGSLRSVIFSKYLSFFGWSPTVLSVSNPYRQYCRIGNTKSPDEVPVVRARCIFNLFAPLNLLNGICSRFYRILNLPVSSIMLHQVLSLCVPDFFLPWIPDAVLKGIRLKRLPYDAIYASCSPLSAAVVGAILKRLTGKPLILDYRDVMNNRIRLGSKAFWPLLHDAVERYLLRVCDHLILAQRNTLEIYLRTYPFLRGKISLIYNGYSDEFLPHSKRSIRDGNGRFTIGYSGWFYHGLSPSAPFFKALRKLLSDGFIPGDKITFRYIGPRDEMLYASIRSYGLEHIFEDLGYSSQKCVRKVVENADVILLRNFGFGITTKLFEGLSLGKTFLALHKGGEFEELLLRYSPHSIVVHPNSESDISHAIIELYRRWEKGELCDVVSEAFQAEFNPYERTRRLACLLSKVTA